MRPIERRGYPVLTPVTTRGDTGPVEKTTVTTLDPPGVYGTGTHTKDVKSRGYGQKRPADRWVRADEVKTHDRLLGSRGGVYEVLGIARTVDHKLALTVRVPSGTIRTWIRAGRFQMERP